MFPLVEDNVLLQIDFSRDYSFAVFVLLRISEVWITISIAYLKGFTNQKAVQRSLAPQ
jgi:hypothetical protein